jgi:hypothetical protein
MFQAQALGTGTTDEQLADRGIPEDGRAFRTVHDSQPALVVSDVQDLGEEDFEEGSDEAEGVPW